MAFKMKGHELPGPNQRKEAPTKWINLVISGISAIASAAKKNREKTQALRDKATAAKKEGVDAASGSMGTDKKTDLGGSMGTDKKETGLGGSVGTGGKFKA